ncbi:carboxylesterase/lipase family protein [Streptomyces sp. VRA16 Mangrove soil]|uniref:carboxylesterase/lipase family protein n=1 Tax=Streptomyces sp. VRA16 Mangrove soil TaxID=2817434 RepID=UPI001A9DFC84|nr:carboxylesterase family protein [Streptomyces sp. VRA16 Mangrove soil]MBO1330494.1 carboxylesterase family protein [Streptomyces sp. VRA16 Mangrove soil]
MGSTVRQRLAWLASFLFLLTLISAVPASAGARSLTVATDKGLVAGATAADVDRFYGIPYAAPPVGTGRWQPPAPAAAWTGTRSATSSGPRCLQNGSNTNPGMSEDCLYLNVYTPAKRTDRPLPVMFWIHGGGFSSGSGDTQDGSLIARTNNVVVVTINYRLGVFGFLDLPGLSKQGAGNYGLLDQEAALRWTQRNIGAFGGDASRVTIGGLSAGGHSVCALMSSPSARGLFSGAIIQSGGCPSYTVEQAVARGKKYATAAGCSATAPDLACLRNKPASELQSAAKDFIGGILSGPLPTAGTPELPVAPLEAVRTGRTANVPLLIGHTRDEIRSWARPFANATKDQYEKAVRIEFGDEADAVLAHYPFSAYGDAYTGAYAFGALWGDSSAFYGLGGCQYLSLTAQFSKRQPRTYYYEFNDPHPPTGGSSSSGFDAGASHGSEFPYLMPSSATSALLTPAQQQLSSEMVRYWGSFVKHGNPAAPGLAAWPLFRAGRFMSLLPGGESQALKTGVYEARRQCAFWNSIDYDWLPLDADKLAAQAGVAQS